MRPTRYCIISFWILHSAFADVGTYECDVMPLAASWTIEVNYCNPDEWVAAGRFYQHTDLCPGTNPPFGQYSSYNRFLAEYAGVEAFWVEWKVVTDGPSDELIYVSPVSFLVGNNSVYYQLIISEDRLRFLRDSSIPVLYFDIDPGEHVYRIEVFGEELYILYVDGQVLDAGVPEDHPYPFLAPDSLIQILTRTTFTPQTTTWDYIRWGELQPNGQGDFDANGEVDDSDVYYFEECYTTEAGNWVGCEWADFDSDGDVDCADAAQFVAAWTGSGEPPVFGGCAAELCEQDLSGDSVIDAADLAVLLGAWGPNPGDPADFNSDGVVDAADLAPLLGAWGLCSK